MQSQWMYNQTRTTPLAYKKAITLLTQHKNEVKNIISNASRKGYAFPHKSFSQELNDYLATYTTTYLLRFPYYNEYLKYIVYGTHLFVFSPRKHRVLDILTLPEKFHAELRVLKSVKLPRNNLPKKSKKK